MAIVRRLERGWRVVARGPSWGFRSWLCCVSAHPAGVGYGREALFAVPLRMAAWRDRLLVIVMMAVVGASVPVRAAVLNSRPVSPLGDNDLQALFANTSSDSPPGIYVAGPTIDAVADQTRQAIFSSTASGGSIASFIIELTASLNTNRLGIYDFADPTKKVERFDAAAGAGGVGTRGS